MAGRQWGVGGVAVARNDAAFGRRAGICHPCQHNGSEKGRPKMLPGNPQPPFFTAGEVKQVKAEFKSANISDSDFCLSSNMPAMLFYHISSCPQIHYQRSL